MYIHTFGDSHASDKHSGWKDCKNIKAHHIGPVLCYSFGRDKLKKIDISKFGIKNNEIIIFCFGEIDCRCHVHKYISKKNTYENIIDNIIKEYILAIKINLDVLKIKLKNVCIYNVVPPVKKINTEENRYYPYLGTDEERKKYVIYFNKCLKEMCLENKWIFFDIYDDYIDNEGFLNKKLSDGNVHIKNGIFLNKFINNNLN